MKRLTIKQKKYLYRLNLKIRKLGYHNTSSKLGIRYQVIDMILKMTDRILQENEYTYGDATYLNYNREMFIKLLK